MKRPKRRFLLVSGVSVAVIGVITGFILLDRAGVPKGMIAVVYGLIVLGVMYGIPSIRRNIK